MLAGNAAESGTLHFAAGEEGAGFVLREDIAEAIARYILLGKKENEVINISSSQTYFFTM